MRRMASEFEAIRASLATWADQNREQIRLAYEELPNEVPDLRAFDDRLQDIAEPLFVLANLADGEQQEEPQVLPTLLEGLRQVAGGREPSSRERGLFEFLAIAKRCLGPDADEQFIPSIELVRECELTDGLGWINGAVKLAGFLRHFDLTSRHSADGGCRGYLIKREWVQQWERILNQDQEAV